MDGLVSGVLAPFEMSVAVTVWLPTVLRMTEKLFVPETNLHVGFKYLRTLLDMYKGNVRLALLAYNRGEDAVWRDVRAGVNPGNGYDLSVLQGYKGKGRIE